MRVRPFLVALAGALLCVACAAPPANSQNGTPSLREGQRHSESGAPSRIHEGTPGRALPSPPEATQQLRIAILPDRTTGRDWGLPYLERGIDDLNRISPDAVISIGDMVQGYTRSAEKWEREADQFRSMVSRLNMPFYPLAGNHEVVSGTRRRDDLTFVGKYQEFFGPLYYSIDFDLATFLILCSDDPQTRDGIGIGIGPDQLAWLDGALQRAAKQPKPIFILMHRPLWRNEETGWNRIVHPLLVKHDVAAVIAGHLHALQRDPDRDGIEHHVVGTCGGMIDQYPLAGQLQHLTFLNIRNDGAFDIYHQPVGVTLPDDFVARADQDRVLHLKTERRVVEFLDSTPDPFLAAVDQTVRVAVFNPIDIPIRVTPTLANAQPQPWTWNSSFWLSRMEQDRSNPFVTDFDTPFRLAAGIKPVSAMPGETARLDIHVTADRVSRPRNPPEFHFIVNFTDSQGREVPVVVRRRLPLRREITFSNDRRSEQWPLSAWEFSVFELLEANPHVVFEWHDNRLIVDVTVPDDNRSGYTDDSLDISERMADPRSDAVVVTVQSGNVEATLYVEPFLSPAVWIVRNGVADRSSSPATVATDRSGWTVRMEVPVFELLGPGAAGSLRINVGVADNDETFHTQWRWLAPDGERAILQLPR